MRLFRSGSKSNEVNLKINSFAEIEWQLLTAEA